MMKRWIALFLAVTMLVSCLSLAGAEELTDVAEGAAEAVDATPTDLPEDEAPADDEGSAEIPEDPTAKEYLVDNITAIDNIDHDDIQITIEYCDNGDWQTIYAATCMDTGL